MDRLPVEVRRVDAVPVDDPDPAHPRGGEIEKRGRAQPPRAHDERGRREELFLARRADFPQEDVPAVSQDVLVLPLHPRIIP
jgi:hypothetical protein